MEVIKVVKDKTVKTINAQHLDIYLKTGWIKYEEPKKK